MVKRFAFFAAVALLVGCVQPQPMRPEAQQAAKPSEAQQHAQEQPPRNLEKDTAEEYAVYSVILAKWPPHVLYNSEILYDYSSASQEPLAPADEREVIVIDEKTRLDKDAWPLHDRALRKLDAQAATAEDFVTKNRRSESLAPRFKIKAKCVMLDEPKRASIFDKDSSEGWRKFHRAFPNSGGIATFSKVGFNEDYTQALTYYTYKAGFAGEGYIILLGKEKGVWVIQRRITSWVE